MCPPLVTVAGLGGRPHKPLPKANGKTGATRNVGLYGKLQRGLTGQHTAGKMLRR